MIQVSLYFLCLIKKTFLITLILGMMLDPRVISPMSLDKCKEVFFFVFGLV